MTDKELTTADRPIQEAGTVALDRRGWALRKAKGAAVLRLLRGYDLEIVSRNFCVSEAILSQWRDVFLAAGEAALTSKPSSGETLEAEPLRARLAEVLIEQELLEKKIAILEAKRPSTDRRQTP